MLAKLLEHFDEIMDCLNFLLWYPDPSRKTPQESICNPTKACVAVILLLQHADDAQLIQSRKVIDYAVGAWAVQDWEGYPYISSAQTDTCPTVKLLHSILVFSPECEQSVCDMLGGDSSESKELRKRVVENAILRCDEMAKMERGPSEAQMRRMAMQQHQGLAGKSGNGVVCALQTTFVYLNSVLSVVEYLCQSPVIAKSFLTSGYFESLAEALKSWLVFQSDKEADRKERFVGVELATAAQGLCCVQGATYRKLSLAAQLSMVHGGLLHILVEGMQSIPTRDNVGSKNIEQMLLMMKQMCSSSPSLGAMLIKPLAQVRMNAMDASFIKGTGYEGMWRNFALHVTASGAVDMIKTRPLICDYMEVRLHSATACALSLNRAFAVHGHKKEVHTQDMFRMSHDSVLLQGVSEKRLAFAAPRRMQQGTI
jgi:hypothetical protein